MTSNTIASALKALHKPGQPLVLANVYDIISARAVAVLPSCKALATASFAVARSNGVEDNNMTLETNLDAVRRIAAVANEFNKPLTVDIQDGYGERLEEAIGALIDLGACGANLEDCDKDTQIMHSQATAVSRIERALAIAKKRGVPDFVLNARCDTLIHGGTLEEVLQRGKAYLSAGATTVFVLGGPKHKITRPDVENMVKAFDGRLNIGWNPEASPFHIKELAEMGVMRVSIGPSLQMMAMEILTREAEKIMNAGS